MKFTSIRFTDGFRGKFTDEEWVEHLDKFTEKETILKDRKNVEISRKILVRENLLRKILNDLIIYSIISIIFCLFVIFVQCVELLIKWLNG